MTAPPSRRPSDPAPDPAPGPAMTGLADRLAARLCHDLAGPAGTVAGMLELYDPALPPDDESDGALDVARQAACQMLCRLKLARAAWAGAADWPAGALAPLAGLVATDRLQVRLDESALAWGRVPAFGRLLLNLVLLGQEVLGERGVIVIEAGPAGTLRATLAPARPWPDFVSPDLAAAEGSDDPRRFQADLTRLLAQAARTELRAAGAQLLIAPAT